MVSPVLAATDSVAWLSSAASGTMASTDSTKSSVCRSAAACSATNTAGTNTSSASNGLCRSRFRAALIEGSSRGVRLDHAADDGEEEPARPGAHQDAGERLDAADEPPLGREHEVTIPGRGICHGAEVERGLEIGHRLPPGVGAGPHRNLHEVHGDHPACQPDEHPRPLPEI